MAGRGGVDNKHWDGVVPPQSLPNSSILRLTENLLWEIAHEPLHSDIDCDKTCGVGPGMAFANSILGKRTVGLIPCAIGGTSITQWAPGTHLYNFMLRRVHAASEGGGDIMGLIWYQGESDTSSFENAEAYKSNMETLIRNLRADLALPTLPIIQVAIASGDERYLEKVREAQKSVDLPNVACVDAKGLPLKDDRLHLTTEAQAKLGYAVKEIFDSKQH